MSRHVGSSRFPHPRRRSGARPAESRSSRAVGRDALRPLRPASPQIQRHAAAHSGGAVRGRAVDRRRRGRGGRRFGGGRERSAGRARLLVAACSRAGERPDRRTRRRGDPGQALRFEVARGQAEAAVRAVREIDPRWRGPRSWTGGEIEGEILHQETRLRAAEVRLRELGDPVVRSEQLGQCLMRGGETIAWRERGAGNGVQTIRRGDFPEVVARMMSGSREATPPGTYSGRFFTRDDGTAIGLRSSLFNNTTLDLYEYNGNRFVPVGKVHQK